MTVRRLAATTRYDTRPAIPKATMPPTTRGRREPLTGPPSPAREVTFTTALLEPGAGSGPPSGSVKLRNAEFTRFVSAATSCKTRRYESAREAPAGTFAKRHVHRRPETFATESLGLMRTVPRGIV